MVFSGNAVLDVSINSILATTSERKWIPVTVSMFSWTRVLLNP